MVKFSMRLVAEEVIHMVGDLDHLDQQWRECEEHDGQQDEGDDGDDGFKWLS